MKKSTMSKVGSHLNVTDTKKKRDKTQTVNIGKGIKVEYAIAAITFYCMWLLSP